MTIPSAEVHIEPRGLRHNNAAAYVGVSPNKFDAWVKDGLMPRPKKVGGVLLWDRRQLDIAFEELPSEDDQPQGWDMSKLQDN